MATGGGFAFASLNDGNETGYDTPQEAAMAFVESLEGSDAIGAAETLVPHERNLIVDKAPEILDELERLGAFSNADLNDVGGVEVDVAEAQLTYSDEPLTTGVSLVRVQGSGLNVTSVSGRVPFGEATDAIEWPGTESFDVAGEVFNQGVELVTVETDARWHVSLLYTGAETIRSQADWGRLDAGTAIEPMGAESPEAAVRTALGALEEGDFRALVSVSDPVGAAVLYDYVPALIRAEPKWERWDADLMPTIHDVSMSVSVRVRAEP